MLSRKSDLLFRRVCRSVCHFLSYYCSVGVKQNLLHKQVTKMCLKRIYLEYIGRFGKTVRLLKRH
jgi:hypothetical protein